MACQTHSAECSRYAFSCDEQKQNEEDVSERQRQRWNAEQTKEERVLFIMSIEFLFILLQGARKVYWFVCYLLAVTKEEESEFMCVYFVFI